MAMPKLTDEQTVQLNDIYVRIVKKFTSFATDSVFLMATSQITLEEAAQIAELELGAKRAKIIEDYNDRVAAIEANALKRGMMYSTFVLDQLDKAFVRKIDALARLESAEEKLAKKVFADNQKFGLAVEREKAVSKSRSLRDFVAASRMKNTVTYDAQTQIDEELYTAYLAWLLQFAPVHGLNLLEGNRLFVVNMGAGQYNKLVADMSWRAGVVIP